MFRHPVIAVALEPREGPLRGIRRVRERPFAISMQADLQQHMLRRVVLKVGDGHDAWKRQESAHAA